MEDFLTEIKDAETRSQGLDVRLQLDASRISSEYADPVSLSLRHIFASIDITLPGTKGFAHMNTSDVRIYLKNTGLAEYVF